MSSKSSRSTPKAYSKTAHDWYLANALFNEIDDGDYRSVEELIVKKEANPNVVIPEKGIAPIHLVTGLDDQNFCHNALKLFLNHGGDPNSRSSDGMTPVHIAAVWGRTSILKLLLKHGGDPWALDNENKNAFSYAHDEEHWETWRFLDDYKNSIIFEKPDKSRYHLKLDCVKIYQNDVCAEYKADPVSLECRSTQTMQNFPNEIILNYGGGKQLPNLSPDEPEGNNSRLPIQNAASSDQLHSRSANDFFDMNFDLLPKDQQRRAIRMVNRHRQTTDVYEYKPNAEGYDADEDHTKSFIEDDTKSFIEDDTKSHIEDQCNDIGYATGSHTPSVHSNASFTNCLKKNSKSAGRALLNTSKDWMANITHRRKLKNSLNKLQDTCNERLKLHVFNRKNGTPNAKGDSNDNTVVSNNNGETCKTTPVSDCSKQKTSNYSVTKSLKRVSSDFNRKLSLVFGNGSKFGSGDRNVNGKESEVFVNKNCLKKYNEVEKLNSSFPRGKRELMGIASEINSNSYQIPRGAKSENILSSSFNSDVGDSSINNRYSNHEVKTSNKERCIGNSNEMVNDFLDAQVTYSKSQCEFNMRMKQFLEEALTEDESKSSENLEKRKLQSCQAHLNSSTEANDSQSASDNFFSCASVEESRSSDNSKCGIVNFNYARNFSRNNAADEVNGNFSNRNQPLRKYGWSIVDTSGNTSINDFNASGDAQNFGNQTPGVANSTPSRRSVLQAIQSDLFNDISKITSPNNVNERPVVNYSNSLVSEDLSVSSSGDSVDLFENNIKTSEFSDNSDRDDVFESARKSSTNVDVHDEPLKRPSHPITAESTGECDLEVSITEEYLYTDEDDGVQLVEECHLPASQPLSEKSPSKVKVNKGESGTVSDESESAVSSVGTAYETDELRRELKEFGLMAGPITKGTKRVYLRKLKRFKRQPRPSEQMPSARAEYCCEMERVLADDELIQKWAHLESEMCTPFQAPDTNKRWREGVSKASFTYLLLDPRITRNLPARSVNMTNKQRFLCFLEAIFYIGRGKRSRPYSHLYEALSIWNRTKYPSSKKVIKILDIWRSGEGVICLHVFQNVIPVEAMTREASMIDAIGLDHLTNEKLGDYYAVASEWTLRKRQHLGIVLLAKALNIFLSEGERQLRPPDISRS